MKPSLSNLSSQSPSLLLIGDDLAPISHHLLSASYSLFQASETQQALTLLRKRAIDLVISAWQSPNFVGLEMLKQLRSTGFQGPVLICTAIQLSNEELHEAMAAGATDFLHLSVSVEDLRLRLQKNLHCFQEQDNLYLLRQSQLRYVTFVTAYFGQELQYLRLLQSQNTTLGLSSETQLQEHLLTEGLIGEFHHLMAWSRQRFERSGVQAHPFAIQHLLKSLNHAFADQSSRLRFRGGRDQVFFSDSELLKRVLVQLLDNAFAYSEGWVTLEIKRKANQLRFVVRDQGRHLSTGKLEDLTAADSSGLGLFIVKDLLTLLQSQLRAKLDRSGGACFYFDLSPL